MRRLWMLLVPAVALASGCSLIFDGSGFVGDAGADAAPGPVDAGTDAGPPDSGPVDSGVDGGPPPVDAGPDPCDMDDDGFLNPSCAPDAGGSDAGVEPLDCDDTDGDVYPGAPPVCGDGVINDCNERDREDTDPPTLSSLLGTDVAIDEPIVSDISSFTDGVKGVLDVALTAGAAGTPPMLALLIGQSDGAGASLISSAVGSSRLWGLDLGGSCFAALSTPATLGNVVATGPSSLGVALARSTAEPAPENWHEAITATLALDTPPDVTYGSCKATTTTQGSITTAALFDPPSTVSAGVYSSSAAGPCLAIADFGCGDGTVTGTTTEFGVGLGNMMLATVTQSDDPAIVARYGSDGAAAVYTMNVGSPVTGRLAAAHDGPTAMVAVPSAETLVLVQQQCSDPACRALSEGFVPVQPSYVFELPPTEALVSIAPFAGGQFLYTHRRRSGPPGVAINFAPRPEEMAGNPVLIPELSFAGTTLFDAAIRSAPVGDRRLFVVAAFTAPIGEPAATDVQRVSFRACIDP